MDDEQRGTIHLRNIGPCQCFGLLALMCAVSRVPKLLALRRLCPGAHVWNAAFGFACHFSRGPIALCRYGCPRSANVHALEDSVLWQLDSSIFRRLRIESAIELRKKHEALVSNVEVRCVRRVRVQLVRPHLPQFLRSLAAALD